MPTMRTSDNSGFNKELLDIILDSFDNDDECKAKTQFMKQAITTMVRALNKHDIV
jgi:hypothetical protein